MKPFEKEGPAALSWKWVWNSQQQSTIFAHSMHNTLSSTYPLQSWRDLAGFEMSLILIHLQRIASTFFIGISVLVGWRDLRCLFRFFSFVSVISWFGIDVKSHDQYCPKTRSLFALKFHYLHFDLTQLFAFSGRMFLGDFFTYSHFYPSYDFIQFNGNIFMQQMKTISNRNEKVISGAQMLSTRMV